MRRPVGVEELTWWELADSAYLASVAFDARHRGEPERPTEAPDRDRPTPVADEGPAVPPPVDWEQPPPSTSSEPRHLTAYSELDVRADGPSWARIPDSLSITRALRPLKRKVPTWREEELVLDEEATAERAVRDGLWWPVTRPGSQRWLDLTVLVDDSPSMSLWRPQVTAFLALLNQLGAFRTTQLRVLTTERSAHGVRTPVLRGARSAAPARDPGEVLSSSGRRVALVVTDGVDESWCQDLFGPLLARLGRTMPVAVLNLMPQRLWTRTGLAVRHTRLTVPGPLMPNSRWQTELAESWLDPEPTAEPAVLGAVPVPVLELNARWLGFWARLITAGDRGPVNAPALLTAGTPRPRVGGYDAVPPYEPSPDVRLRQFASIASPAAVRLATLLAAVPVSVPIARVVQSELIPESGPAHLVEVLTSGLLRPTETTGASSNWGEVTFEFPESMRERLLMGARRSDTARVVRLVADRFGDEFPELRGFRDAIEAPDTTPDPMRAPLVSIQQTVMRALSGPYLGRADRLSNVLRSQADRSEPTARFEAPFDAKTTVTVAGTGTPERSGQVEHVPAVWGNVPPRNPYFTGRMDLLGQLQNRLATGATVLLPAALYGMGGIGKTQLAVEYIYRRFGEYDLVWWIQATQSTQIRAGLTELAEALGLPGSDDASTAVPTVLDALSTGQPYSRWLLVFDAAEDPDLVRSFLPNKGPGEILVTSRNPDWASIARPLEVPVFRREESVELLRRRGPNTEEEDANRLAEKLGDLPLAVDQAAAWRSQTGMAVAEYLRLFDEQVAAIYDLAVPLDYQVSVAAAWNVSFDALQTRNPAAHQLLQVCAFFAPEPVSRNLFVGVHGVSISPELDAALRDPMRLGRAIRDISRLGLAKIDYRTNTIMLHRLVQAVLRERMSPTTRAAMRYGAHMLLAHYDPNDPTSSKQWPRYQDVLPHVYASDLVECEDPWARQLLLNLSLFLYHWGDQKEAAALAQQAFAIWSERHGENDKHTLLAAGYLGLYLWSLGRYAEAAEINLRTLALRREVSGEDAEETILAELRVAVDMKARGEFSAALELNDKIYRKARKLYGEDDPVTLQTAHDLATAARLCGEHRRAFQLDEDTYQRRAEVLGYDNVDTLNTFSAMLLDRRELGEFAEARAEHEEFAERVRKILGENRPGTLRRLADLAVARRKDGDHAAALELSTKVFGVFQTRYGPDHPNTMDCAISHSINLRHEGWLDEANALGKQIFERYQDKLGSRHPNTLAAAVDLAATLRERGDAKLARQLAESSVKRLRTSLGPDHPYAIVAAIELASDLAAVGQPGPAASLGAETAERAQRVLGADHPTTLAANLNLVLDLRAAGRAAHAVRLYERVHAGLRRVLGAEHPATVTAARRGRVTCDIDPLPG